MSRIDPVNFFRLLHGRYVQIDNDRLLIAAHDYARKRFIGCRVDLLMRHIGWHVDKIARAGLGAKLQLFSPSQARPAADYIDNTFELAMMMGRGLGGRFDAGGSGPELIRSGSGVI